MKKAPLNEVPASEVYTDGRVMLVEDFLVLVVGQARTVQDGNTYLVYKDAACTEPHFVAPDASTVQRIAKAAVKRIRDAEPPEPQQQEPPRRQPGERW